MPKSPSSPRLICFAILAAPLLAGLPALPAAAQDTAREVAVRAQTERAIAASRAALDASLRLAGQVERSRRPAAHRGARQGRHLPFRARGAGPLAGRRVRTGGRRLFPVFLRALPGDRG